MSTRLAELREWGGPAHGPNKNGQNPSWNRHGLNNLKRKFLRISERGGKGNLTTKMYLVFLSFYTSLRSRQYWKHGKFSCTCYECKSLFVGTWSLVVIKNEEIQLQSTEPGKATNCPGCFLQNKHLYLWVLNWFHKKLIIQFFIYSFILSSTFFISLTFEILLVVSRLIVMRWRHMLEDLKIHSCLDPLWTKLKHFSRGMPRGNSIWRENILGKFRPDHVTSTFTKWRLRRLVTLFS